MCWASLPLLLLWLCCVHKLCCTQFLLPGYCPEAWRWCPQIKLESPPTPPTEFVFFLVHMFYYAHSCPNFYCVSETVCIGWCWKGVLHKLHFLVWDYTFLLVEVLRILVGGKQVCSCSIQFSSCFYASLPGETTSVFNHLKSPFWSDKLKASSPVINSAPNFPGRIYVKFLCIVWPTQSAQHVQCSACFLGLSVAHGRVYDVNS